MITQANKKHEDWHKFFVTFPKKNAIDGDNTLRCSELGLAFVANSNFCKGQWIKVETIRKRS